MMAICNPETRRGNNKKKLIRLDRRETETRAQRQSTGSAASMEGEGGGRQWRGRGGGRDLTLMSGSGQPTRAEDGDVRVKERGETADGGGCGGGGGGGGD